MSRRSVALRDPEVIELLADEPELLAIADAIAATFGRVRRPHWHGRGAIALAAVVGALALALAAPWSTSRGGVVEKKALAALETNEVLHVVLVSEVSGASTIDLATGKARPAVLRVEEWFDATRSLKSYRTTRLGAHEDFLQTKAGTWSSTGPVATCAWIAAHPAKAAKLRVSCPQTSAGRLKEPTPAVEPSLMKFLTGYRAALREGSAHTVGPGIVEGVPVYWIEFPVPGSPHVRERVAVTKQTFKPVMIETRRQGVPPQRTAVAVIEKIAYARSLFARPEVNNFPTPVAGQVSKTRHVSRATAERALGAEVRSLGRAFASLPLIDARVDQLTTGFGPLSTAPFAHGRGVQFIYGDPGISRAPFLRVSEALTPEFGYGMQRGAVEPGNLLLNEVRSQTAPARAHGSGWKCYAVCGTQSLFIGQMRVGSLFVALEGSSRALVLRAAQALGGAK
jgi:hypothetical protein